MLKNDRIVAFATFITTIVIMLIGFCTMVTKYEANDYMLDTSTASEVPIIKIGVSPEPVTVAPTAEPTPTATPMHWASLGVYKVTAYCSCCECCGKCDGITASGTAATEGRTIAADTSILPFGSQVVINGHEYTVEDRGGSVKGNTIDIYMDSHEAAVEFGVQYIEVYASYLTK